MQFSVFVPEGEPVNYEVTDEGKGPQAENVVSLK